VSLAIWSGLDISSELLAPHRSVPLAEAQVACRQPDVEACLAAPNLRWVHLISAGWDRFAVARERFEARGICITNSSSVYSEPCAQHALSFLLTDARQLSRSARHQHTDRAWTQWPTRKDCALLGPQSTVALVGFGSIARRLAELLTPFGARLLGVRRNPTGREPVPTLAISELPARLPEIDHVVNILPGGAETRHYFDARLFERMKLGTAFYNIGRGSTVDQSALVAALESSRLRAAYLDVTEPEPLPPEHPLWSAPNCFITPHAAGGTHDEPERLQRHFLDNLARYAKAEPLVDRVV
jgi:phosphoglycerate dehydrogenase-like enzyme